MKLVIISDSLRRDFQDPIKYFSKLEVVHLYRTANYGDMREKDFKDTIKVNGFFDVFKHLNYLKPDLIAAPEPYQGWSRFTKISTKMMRLWLPAVFCKIKHPRSILFFHCLENIPDDRRFGWLTPIARMILGWYAKYCDFIVYLNEGAKDNLINANVSSKKLVHLLWGNWGVDINEFRPPSSNVPVSNSRHPVILFVGRIDYLKGIEYLIEAFKHLQQDYPRAELWIAGDGPLRSRYQNLDGVKMLGIVKNQDLPILFQRAWITSVPAVTTSIWAEQVGMVNIQSLACGTPVVSTTSGAIPEFVDDKSAILVKEKDSAALYRALKKLTGDPGLRREMGRAGRKLALEKYDASKNIQNIETFLIEKIK